MRVERRVAGESQHLPATINKKFATKLSQKYVGTHMYNVSFRQTDGSTEIVMTDQVAP